LIDDTLFGQRSVTIHRRAEIFHHPIVDQCVSRPCVEGKQYSARADIGDVGDPADIQHHHRHQRAGAARQRLMVKRCEGSTLAAACDVGVTKITDDRYSGLACQHGPIAELPASTLAGPVQNSLTVKPYIGDVTGLQSGLA
jgi:hypothetical protein